MIYSSAVWFLKYLKQINIDISAAEKELERSIRNEDLLRLMRLQKTLVYFNTSIRGNEVMIGKLKTIFQDTDFLDKELVEDVYHRIETSTQYGEHLQRHSHWDNGRLRLHYLKQCEHYHETYDQLVYRLNAPYIDCQFLWHERRYSSGRSALCFFFDCTLLYRIVHAGVCDIQKDQMVLTYKSLSSTIE